MITDQKTKKQIIGVYLTGDLDDTQIGVTIIPNIFRKLFIRLFLGWKFVTIEKLKELKNND